MLAFRKMHLEVYKSKCPGWPDGREMVSLQAQEPVDAAPDRRAGDGDEGLRYLSFYFTRREFVDVFTGKSSGANDIGHNVRASGELFTFYDLDYPQARRGVMRVPYVHVTVPHYVGRLLARLVKRTLRSCVEDGDRLMIDLPWALREKWMRRYGQATGKVVFDMDDVTAAAKHNAAIVDSSGKFEQCIEQLQRIAANSTYKWTDTGTVVLSAERDGSGFYFQILTPRGKRSLNGGVINHGRGGVPDWSMHT